MKLTDLQRTTLKLVAGGCVYQQKFGYGAWRIQGASPTVVGKLISMGLAEWGPHGEKQIGCVLTDAGRAENGELPL